MSKKRPSTPQPIDSVLVDHSIDDSDMDEFLRLYEKSGKYLSLIRSQRHNSVSREIDQELLDFYKAKLKEIYSTFSRESSAFSEQETTALRLLARTVAAQPSPRQAPPPVAATAQSEPAPDVVDEEPDQVVTAPATKTPPSVVVPEKNSFHGKYRKTVVPKERAPSSTFTEQRAAENQAANLRQNSDAMHFIK